MGDQKKQVILSKPEDWDTWISFVRIKAENHEVWNLINPDLPSKPNALIKPVQPTFNLRDASTFDPKAFEFYKARQIVYKSDLALYNEQKIAFTSIISLIQETITAENAIFIQKTKSHPYNLLVALKPSRQQVEGETGLDRSSSILFHIGSLSHPPTAPQQTASQDAQSSHVRVLA